MKRAFLLAASAAVLAACEGSQPLTFGEWLTEYADTYCNGNSNCCEELGVPAFPDYCMQGMHYYSDAVSSGATYDPVMAERCLQDLRAFFSNCPPSGPEPRTCAQVVRGMRGPGEACSAWPDCAAPEGGNATCDRSPVPSWPYYEGICVIQPAPAAGQPCLDPPSEPYVHYECAHDPLFYCEYTANTCRRRPTVGQSCADGALCTNDAFCDVDHVCVAKVPVGASCESPGSYCTPTAFCDPSARACVYRKPAGADCNESTECWGWCSADVCVGTSDSVRCFGAELD